MLNTLCLLNNLFLQKKENNSPKNSLEIGELRFLTDNLSAQMLGAFQQEARKSIVEI